MKITAHVRRVYLAETLSATQNSLNDSTSLEVNPAFFMEFFLAGQSEERLTVFVYRPWGSCVCCGKRDSLPGWLCY